MSCNCCCSFCMSFVLSREPLFIIPGGCGAGGGVPPQHTMNGTVFSMEDRHCTHFFISCPQPSQAHMCPQGKKRVDAFLSEHTTHSSILVRDWTCSLHIRHFLTRGEHSEQVAMCPHGPNRVSLFRSEQTMHSSSDSWSFRRMTVLEAVPFGLCLSL